MTSFLSLWKTNNILLKYELDQNTRSNKGPKQKGELKIPLTFLSTPERLCKRNKMPATCTLAFLYTGFFVFPFLLVRPNTHKSKICADNTNICRDKSSTVFLECSSIRVVWSTKCLLVDWFYAMSIYNIGSWPKSI